MKKVLIYLVMSESIVDQLDLVRANPNLHFPDNVTLNFVYWQHVAENLPDIRPYLLTADAVALESFTIDRDEGYSQKAAGRRMTAVVNHIVQGIASDEDHGFLEGYDDYTWEVARLLASLPKKPRIFFVDDYADVPEEEVSLFDDLTSGASYERGSHIEDWLYFNSETTFHRESVALSQLSAIASRLGRSGSNREIAVLYGANHRLLSVAARRFGANVVRHSVHDHAIDRVTQVASRLIRFGMLPDLDSLSEEDLLTIKAAAEADRASGYVRSVSGPMMSSANLLEAVSALEPSAREYLLMVAREVNTGNDKANEKYNKKPKIVKRVTAPKTKRLSLEKIFDGSIS